MLVCVYFRNFRAIRLNDGLMQHSPIATFEKQESLHCFQIKLNFLTSEFRSIRIQMWYLLTCWAYEIINLSSTCNQKYWFRFIGLWQWYDLVKKKYIYILLLTFSIVLILKEVRHFGSRICFRLQVKSEEAPNVVDALQELLSITGHQSHIEVKLKWSLYRPHVAQRVGRGIALLFHDCGTRRGWVVSSTSRSHFTLGKEPVTILQAAGWAQWPVWTKGKSRPHRDSIPDRPVRSQSLYRLSYPAHTTPLNMTNANASTILGTSRFSRRRKHLRRPRPHNTLRIKETDDVLKKIFSWNQYWLFIYAPWFACQLTVSNFVWIWCRTKVYF